MRALVTGGTGFIGGHLVEALVNRGDEVTALVRSPGKAARIEALGVRMVRGDLDDLPALDRATADQEVVYHVAGLVRAGDEAAFLHANRQGAANLSAAAAGAGVRRFVLVSSMAAGGPTRPGQPLVGDEPARPVTAYGRSKLAGEQVVRETAPGFRIVRPPMVYGPGDTEFLRLFRLVRWGIAPVFGGGDQELSAVYGPDLAEALVATATTETTLGGTYYACHAERLSSADFARAVGRVMGRRVRVVPLSAGLTRGLLGLMGATARMLGTTTVLDRDKANELLAPAWTGDPGPLLRDAGWRAGHDLATGLAATANWYRDHGMV